MAADPSSESPQSAPKFKTLPGKTIAETAGSTNLPAQAAARINAIAPHPSPKFVKLPLPPSRRTPAMAEAFPAETAAVSHRAEAKAVAVEVTHRAGAVAFAAMARSAAAAVDHSPDGFDD